MVFGRISADQGLNSENFVWLPKVLIGTKYYSKLQAEAKFMFMLFRDRFSSSLDQARKGNMTFIDDEGDVFIYYPIEEIAKDLGIGRDKAIKLKKELIAYDLIDEVRQGLRKANKIYLKNCVTDIKVLNMTFEEGKKSLQLEKSTEVENADFQKSEKSTSRNREIRLPEVGKSDGSNNKKSKTKSNTKYSSRKAEKISEEISQPTGADDIQSQDRNGKYIPAQYYSLLEVIADRYNGKYCQYDLFEGEFRKFRLTHKQKMLIGNYMADGYVTSEEVLSLIDKMDYELDKPLAYLLKSLENLKQERLLEAKYIAHKQAEAYYAKGGD